MPEQPGLKGLPETRREIITLLKQVGSATAADLAGQLQISDEAVRQHLVALETAGWIARETLRPETPKAGRPRAHYRVTDAGDDLFPKKYDDLSLLLIENVMENYGEGAIRSTLEAITDGQVRAWEDRLRGKTLREKLELLKGFYLEDDSFITVEEKGGDLYLVEVNCPIRRVAMKYPAVCSTTISTLMRLLGYRIRRVGKFQAGDGKCVFKVMQDQPVQDDEFRFELEPAG